VHKWLDVNELIFIIDNYYYCSHLITLFSWYSLFDHLADNTEYFV